ncbi:hypothetical protein AB6A40_003931 [Gnathostoma spinigerum]|uniref:Nucleotide-diphospho-sugar transferase domain-containing protein n=1 Tax=Gnathostoma spinigerum TaxID=75299 RepID=A0ABD6EKJ5_9BILA
MTNPMAGHITLRFRLLAMFISAWLTYLGLYSLFIYQSNQNSLTARIDRPLPSLTERTEVIEVSEENLAESNLQNESGESNSSIPNEHITVITMLDNTEKLKDYALALDTMRCYCKGHGYNYILLDLSTNRTFDKACKHQHIWYRRHCVLAEILKRAPTYNTSGTWFVAVDADTGVINPRHKIQEWIDDTVDIIFYNRIWQFELMAGIFMVKKSSLAEQFLLRWAAYPDVEPKSLRFFDNVMIHSVVMDLMRPQRPAERKVCDGLLHISTKWDDAYVYEACARMVMRNMSFDGGKMLIYKKGGSWCRDGWLLSSKWCPNDFFLHGWQIRSETGHELYERSLLSHTFKDSDCHPHNFLGAWQYNVSFMDSCESIEAGLKSYIDGSDKKFNKAVTEVQKFAANHSYDSDFFFSFSAPWHETIIA